MFVLLGFEDAEAVVVIDVRSGIERGGHLTRAIGAEVEEDARIAVVHRTCLADDRRQYELIIVAALVSGTDRSFGAGSAMFGLAEREHVVRSVGTIPAAVAIHRVEAAADAGDRALAPDGGELLFELLDIGERRARRRIAAVEKAVHGDRNAGGNRGVD